MNRPKGIVSRSGSTRRARVALTVGLLSLVVACGGRSTNRGTVDEAGAGGAASSDAGGGGVAGGAGSATGGCPALLPVDGSPCTLPYATRLGPGTCSYGDDPRPQCRSTALCSGGSWQTKIANCSEPPLPAACPTKPADDTSVCTDIALACWYGDGSHCRCSPFADGREYPIGSPIDPPRWHCVPRPTDCPLLLPQAGSPCSASGASCGPDCTYVVTCTDGLWLWRGFECPMCAAPDTPIATPNGEQAIASLRVGDLVYSVDHDAIVAVPVLKIGQNSVTRHHIVRVVLDNGRVLEISAGHPTADGRTFGDLFAGGQIDPEHRVLAAERAPYDYDATYDILPASSTGTYFAAGALIGSTLFGR